jgi:tetratricopeptide (TPR) repeat protein
MKRKGKIALEDHKMSKLQLILCFSVFILMLIILLIFANSANRSIIPIAIVFIPLVCLVFAFLMREPASAGWLKTLEISLRGFSLKLERNEQHPHEIVQFTPKGARPPTTKEAASLHDQGNEEYHKGNFIKAAGLYKKAFETDPTYWPVRINQAMSLKEAGKYDSALSILRSVKETCKENTYIVQAYINTGDCFVYKSLNCSDLKTAFRWRRAAYDNYQVAYVKEPASIIPVYHLWFGALVAEERAEALKLARIIEMHDGYYELTSEARNYFEKHYKEASDVNMEELIMNWRKLVIAVMVAFVALNLSILLFAGAHGGSLFEIMLDISGVMNGNALRPTVINYDKDEGNNARRLCKDRPVCLPLSTNI